MSRIVILGQSAGVYELARTLAQTVKDGNVTILSLDGQLPHDQSRLADYLGKVVSKDQLLCVDKDFYQQNQVELILDQKPERISLRQKKITTESKQHIKFDALIIADAPEVRWPDVKGVQKQGVYHVRSLGAADPVLQRLPFVKSVVIQIYDWNDVKAALALKAWGREVTVVVPFDTLMARMLEHDVCEMIMASFKEETWNVYYGQSIEEILGDSEAKAVRLSSGKVLAADMVIVGHLEARLRILDDVSGEDAASIAVDSGFRSKAEHVYAFGDIAERSGDKVCYWNMTPADWKTQAEQLAGVLCGREQAGGEACAGLEPVVSYALDLPQWSLRVLGDITPAANMVTFRSWNAGARVYQKIFTVDGKINGAVVMNLAQAGHYEYLVSERIRVAGSEHHVFDTALSLERLREFLTHPPADHADEEDGQFSPEEGAHLGAGQVNGNF